MASYNTANYIDPFDPANFNYMGVPRPSSGSPGQADLSPEWLNFLKKGMDRRDMEGNRTSPSDYFWDIPTGWVAVTNSDGSPGFRAFNTGGIQINPNSDVMAQLNGLPSFRYDDSGRYIGTEQERGWHKSDGGMSDIYGALGIMALPFAASAAGIGAAGAGAAGAAGTGVTVGGAMSTAVPTITELGTLGAGAAGVGGLAGAGAGAAGAAGAGGVLSSLGGWGSLIGPAAGLIGGALAANAAGDAADAMAGAANAGIAEQRRQFDTVRGLLSPYVTAGNTSLGAYQDLSGANGPDKQRAAMAALEGSPQFASLAKAGENAILQNASATGGLRGGNVQGALADKRTQILNGLTQQQLGNYLPIINGGQASAAGVGNAAMATGSNVANLLGQQGAAQAGGIVAGSNAITNTIGSLGGFFAGQAAGNVGGGAPAPLSSTYAAPTMGTTGSFGTSVVPGYGFQPRYF